MLELIVQVKIWRENRVILINLSTMVSRLVHPQKERRKLLLGPGLSVQCHLIRATTPFGEVEFVRQLSAVTALCTATSVVAVPLVAVPLSHCAGTTPTPGPHSLVSPRPGPGSMPGLRLDQVLQSFKLLCNRYVNV